MYLKPSEIKYSQDSISCFFSQPQGKRIGETLDDLCEGRIGVTDIKPISVVLVKSEWVTVDNRRLWVFKHLERLGKCYQIPVREKNSIFDTRMTTTCGGNSVKVRGNPGGEWYKKSWTPPRRNVSYSGTRSTNESYSGTRSTKPPASDDSSLLGTLWTIAKYTIAIGAVLAITFTKK